MPAAWALTPRQPVSAPARSADSVWHCSGLVLASGTGTMCTWTRQRCGRTGVKFVASETHLFYIHLLFTTGLHRPLKLLAFYSSAPLYSMCARQCPCLAEHAQCCARATARFEHAADSDTDGCWKSSLLVWWLHRAPWGGYSHFAGSAHHGNTRLFAAMRPARDPRPPRLAVAQQAAAQLVGATLAI